MIPSFSSTHIWWTTATAMLSIGSVTADPSSSSCFSDDTLNEIFRTNRPTCCQNDVCGIPCPTPIGDPHVGYSLAVSAGIAVSFLIGVEALFYIEGKPMNFFLAGRSLPLWMLVATMGSQSIDSNSLLGNVDLSYKYHFWDGAVLPIGLALSLVLNGIFLAHKINADRNGGILTLPDILAKRYGRIVEVLVSIATVVSFMMLLAGNLRGMGVIVSYLWNISAASGIWISLAITWTYTISGGLYAVAYTDIFQALVAWTGCVAFTYYMIANESPNAPPPSIGFPGYVYPDNIGDGGICDLYSGEPCQYQTGFCCYNSTLHCPDGPDIGCLSSDNGAYPIGDQNIFHSGMTDPLANTPFPNAIFWNWSTIFILAFGNLAALDFQARCMAAKTPQIARLGCFIAAVFTLFVAIPFSFMGSITRVYYGPDSIHAVFEADSCSALLGLPTCGRWVPDSEAFVKFLTHEAPNGLGGWCLFGIVAASMSTADGAILAIGSVTSHNLMRQLNYFYPDLVNDNNLVMIARVATLPLAIVSTLIAAYLNSAHSAGATGYLLIVAFDVVLATVVVPLFGCYYTRTPRPNAALLSVLGGATTRLVLEFVIPKDGSLLLPYDNQEFLDYGDAASDKFPPFFDKPADLLWNPDVEKCYQSQYEDFTGVDSISAFLVSLVVFVLVQTLEHRKGGPLFSLPGMEPYVKTKEPVDEEKRKLTKARRGDPAC